MKVHILIPFGLIGKLKLVYLGGLGPSLARLRVIAPGLNPAVKSRAFGCAVFPIQLVVFNIVPQAQGEPCGATLPWLSLL